MDILGIFRDRANELLKNNGVDVSVEPSREGFGDFTLPCFTLAKKHRKNPVDIAKELARKIEDKEYFKRVEAVGPYLNFYINHEKLVKTTIESIINGNMYSFEPKEKVIVEHTSANPTGPLHVGRARNPIIGDTMARILRAYGHEVEVHYFVNDAGMQVATLLWGLLHKNIRESEKKCDHALVKNYQFASRMAAEDKEVENEIRELMKKYENGDEKLRVLARNRIGCVLNGIAESLNRLNIYIDKFVWESNLIEMARDIAKDLEPFTEEENGAYYLDMKKIGANLQKDKFFLYRQDGTTLYFLRDIAYHVYKTKIARKMVDVLGEDHKLHFEAIRAVMKYLKPEIEIKPLFYSFVRLPEGKMSTRRGTVVYLDDLVDEGKAKAMEILKNRNYRKDEMEKIAEGIATSAIRFSILNIQEEKPIVFTWDKALSFEGESAPFIIYSYARACSILRKAEYPEEYDLRKINDPQEIKLIKLMAQYHEIIENAVNSLSPFILSKYAYSLALQFNQFYKDCPVLNAPGDLKNARLILVKSFKIHMETILKMLGLTALEKM